MEQMNINPLAVLACIIANLALGALWYSPAFFYKAWKKENNFTEEQLKQSIQQKHMALVLFSL